MTSIFQWLSESWLTSIVRTISLGGVAIVVFWLIDRVCQSLTATQRSWLWRLLYIKLASLLFCSFTILSLPTAVKFWSMPSSESPITIGGSAFDFSAHDFVQAYPQSNNAEGIPELSLQGSVAPKSQQWPAFPLVLAIAWFVGAVGPGRKNQESVSKTINTVDGKGTMTVTVTTNSRSILIHQDAKGTFRVEIQEQCEGDLEKKSYVADSRKEFAKAHPEVYESIKSYLQDRPPVAPVAPVAPTNLKHAVVAGAQSPVTVSGIKLNPVQSLKAVKVEGKPLSRVVAGVAIAPSVPSVPSVPAIASVPAAPSVPAVPAVPSIPSEPREPSEPALPALEGVLGALEKIRSESEGNLEIERLIESIKAKLDEKE